MVYIIHNTLSGKEIEFENDYFAQGGMKI